MWVNIYLISCIISFSHFSNRKGFTSPLLVLSYGPPYLPITAYGKIQCKKTFPQLLFSPCILENKLRRFSHDAKLPNYLIVENLRLIIKCIRHKSVWEILSIVAFISYSFFHNCLLFTCCSKGIIVNMTIRRFALWMLEPVPSTSQWICTIQGQL